MAGKTPEETSRWRVSKIRSVLAKAGLPAFEMHHAPVSMFGDAVRQDGYNVSSRTGEHDCVYAEWIDHWMTRGERWRRETERMAQVLRDDGYTVEGPLLLGGNWTNGMLRVTRPDIENTTD